MKYGDIRMTGGECAFPIPDVNESTLGAKGPANGTPVPSGAEPHIRTPFAGVTIPHGVEETPGEVIHSTSSRVSVHGLDGEGEHPGLTAIKGSGTPPGLGRSVGGKA